MYYRYHDMKRKGQRTHREKDSGSGVGTQAPPNTRSSNNNSTNKRSAADDQQPPNPPIPSTITCPASNHDESKESSAKGHMKSLQASLQRLHVTKKRRQQVHVHVAPIDDAAKDKDCSKLQTQEEKTFDSVELIFDEDPIVNKILSDLYHDFLNEATASGDPNALSNDDKLLLESASSAAFDMINEDELDDIIKSM